MENKRFELGKCYEHSSGLQIHICGLMDTIFYGICFVAENGYNVEKLIQKQKEWDNWNYAERGLRVGDRPGSKNWIETFTPISKEEDATANYFEIPIEEFINNNTTK